MQVCCAACASASACNSLQMTAADESGGGRAVAPLVLNKSWQVSWPEIWSCPRGFACSAPPTVSGLQWPVELETRPRATAGQHGPCSQTGAYAAAPPASRPLRVSISLSRPCKSSQSRQRPPIASCEQPRRPAANPGFAACRHAGQELLDRFDGGDSAGSAARRAGEWSRGSRWAPPPQAEPNAPP